MASLFGVFMVQLAMRASVFCAKKEFGHVVTDKYLEQNFEKNVSSK